MIRLSILRPTSSLTGGLVALVLLVLLSSAAQAQELPRIEAYGSYSLLRPNLPSVGDDPAIEAVGEFVLSNVLGWNAGATVNITNSFGITADFAGYYKSIDTRIEGADAEAHLKLHTFLFGPRFVRPGERLRPFAQALFGVGRARAELELDAEFFDESVSTFAASIGGGLDILVHRNVAVRAIQFDYFPVRHSNGDTLTFNNFRWGSGVVFQISPR